VEIIATVLLPYEKVRLVILKDFPGWKPDWMWSPISGMGTNAPGDEPKSKKFWSVQFKLDIGLHGLKDSTWIVTIRSGGFARS